jgi:hypothetical protein
MIKIKHVAAATILAFGVTVAATGCSHKALEPFRLSLLIMSITPMRK